MIGLPFLYGLTGSLFGAYALLSLRARRWGNGGFWGLLAFSFLAGNQLGDLGNGVLVLALVAMASSGVIRGAESSDPPQDGRQWGARLFVPALIIPVTALVGSLFLKPSGLIDPKQITLISLAFGLIIALATIQIWLRPSPMLALQQGRRLIDAVGWAAILPQMLASLGVVFASAGVGDIVGQAAHGLIPEGSLLAAVIAYALGMALFTMIMGNAFAAFPVMSSAIGVPLLVHHHGGNPAAIGAVGMLAGFCGTLMTPMAANFNIVPAALLQLRDRNAVVKVQIATACPLLLANILLIYLLAFP